MSGASSHLSPTYQVLGPLRVLQGGDEVVIGGLLQRRLLGALLLHRNRVVSTDRLTEMVWPDEELPPGPGVLHSHLSRLRQRIPGMVVDHRPPGYVLRVDDVDLDVHLFERAVIDAGTTQREGGDGALAVLEEALDLWRGQPFEELMDVYDGRIEIERLNELRLRALEDRFDLMVRLGRSAEIIADLESYVAREPLRERPRRTLIDALSAVGRRAESLRVFDAYRRTLAEELGVAPSVQLRARHEELLAEDDVGASSLPPDPGRTRIHRGLPEGKLSSFVGRTDLSRELQRHVGVARLITLIGPGGVGKTRLAVEAARGLRDSFPDGCVFCDLTEAGPASVATVVLVAVGVESRAGQDDFGRLADVMRTDRCLLVLDNCEHVIDEAAGLAEGLLRQTENVVMIATSRERLAVEGEQLLVVPPLSSDSTSSAGMSPAVELLRDRARSVDPGFDVDAISRAEVEELCRRLDGLPLAIELAAGRLQTLSLSEVKDGFEASLAVLRGGRRTIGRHRSVEAALDWSYQLLDEPERAVLHAAALFAAAFDAADVAHVLDAELVPTRDRLARLVECSLAHRVDTHFALLDVVRRFAADRMSSSGATTSPAHQRHAGRMLVRAKELSDSLPLARDSSPVTELDRLFGDFRNATVTAIAAEDADVSLGIVTSLRELALNAMVPELMSWGVDAAEIGERQRHPLTPDAYAAAAQGAWKRGDLLEMRRLLDRAVGAAASLGIGDRYEVLGSIGTEHLAHGRLAEAVDCFRRSLVCEEAIGNPLRQAESGATLAICMSYAHHEGAIAVADRLIDEVVPLGGAVAAAWCWYGAGECRIDSDPSLARRYLERAVEMARRGGGSFVEGVAGASLASLDVRGRQPRRRNRTLPVATSALASRRGSRSVLDRDAFGRRPLDPARRGPTGRATAWRCDVASVRS